MINTVYNYYLSTYSQKELSRYDVHKKSELRSIYNNILKLSKNSPLYQLDLSEESQKYVIDLKENAISLKNVLNDFNYDAFNSASAIKTKAVSSNEDIASVKFIGDDSNDAETIKLSVQKLATPQINTGNYLDNRQPELPIGNYTFEVNLGEYYYEFHTSVKVNDTNQSLQERLARLVNKSKIGLTADVKQANNGYTALEIQSLKTGITDFKPGIFTIQEGDNDDLKGIVDYIGMNAIGTEASNAKVTIDDVPRSVSSNVFALKGTYEVAINNTSLDEESVTIALEEDYESLIDSVKKLATNYNNIITITKDNSEYVNRSAFLLNDLSKLSFIHKNTLEPIGLTVGEDGTLKVDDSLFVQSIKEGSLSETLAEIHTFKNNMIGKLNEITIDPMRFVNKKMMSYPHPVKPFTNPYITSIYSGMMFNGYI